VFSEIGENAVVLLSTHIVEDVSDLCPRMAIPAGGRVVLEGEPARLIADPEPGFEPAAPDLEDVYFSVLSSLPRREERESHAERDRIFILPACRYCSMPRRRCSFTR
jgi:ABC-type multidrug transport system ATPase subunit